MARQKLAAQAGLDLAGPARLLQAAHALLALAAPQQQDRGGLGPGHRVDAAVASTTGALVEIIGSTRSMVLLLRIG